MTDPAVDRADPPRRGRMRSALRWLVPIAVVTFVVLQLVPYGWEHSNPAVTQDAPWLDGAAAQLAHDACYDCHSNATEWPPYSYVAPMSWLVRRDVERGRDALNFSEWDRGGGEEVDDAAETIEDGSMPPRQYVLLHPDADLSDAEKATLIAALDALAEGEDRRDDGDRGDADNDDGDSSGRGRGGDADD